MNEIVVRNHTRDKSFDVLSLLYKKIFIKALKKVDRGELTLELPKRKKILLKGSKPGALAHMRIIDEGSIKKFILEGDNGMADSFIEGHWNSDNLDMLFKWALENENKLLKENKGALPLRWLGNLRHKFFKRNTLQGSQKNIHKHYDLGNDFFSLWLDQSMTYSSACFDGNYSLSLYDAQMVKYQKIVDMLKLKPGDHILEIGCGWGGFSEYVLKRGFKITAITISEQQLEYSKKRLDQFIQSGQAEVKYLDYRKLDGKYDAIVSIEMIEAVGLEYWKTYLKKVKECLRPGGRFVFQGISINEKDFASYSKEHDFIQRHIFPGGMLISESKIKEMFKELKMKHFSENHFGEDYAETLRRWKILFNQKSSDVLKLKLDQRFIRLWNYYLSYCEAGFMSGKIDVVQMGVVNE